MDILLATLVVLLSWLWGGSELRVLVSLAVTHIISWPAAVMRWCVFPERCGTSNRMILGDRRPSVALIALHVRTHKHTHTVGIHCHYSWPVSRSTLYTNHCSLLSTAGGGQRVKAKGTKWEQQCRENNGTHQSGTEWKREEKQWLKMRETKENTMFQAQSKECRYERRRRQSGTETYMALCLSKDKNKLSYPYQT